MSIVVELIKLKSQIEWYFDKKYKACAIIDKFKIKQK